jgi:hypothetical protein
MHQVGSEPTNQAIQREKMFRALDRWVTMIGAII